MIREQTLASYSSLSRHQLRDITTLMIKGQHSAIWPLVFVASSNAAMQIGRVDGEMGKREDRCAELHPDAFPMGATTIYTKKLRGVNCIRLPAPPLLLL
ncbi:hypothetical protein R1flu_023447 [Riccia fluitans]|uniref:Uncharacterized protein n=1 Tax=Riccia fluitans TaxID=41844 RepID=A0ABD1XSK5_9MARC